MPDPDYLTLRGKLSEAQDRLRMAESRVVNAIEAARRHLLIYETPEQIRIEETRAAVADLAEERSRWIAIREEINALKSRLGMP